MIRQALYLILFLAFTFMIISILIGGRSFHPDPGHITEIFDAVIR